MTSAAAAISDELFLQKFKQKFQSATEQNQTTLVQTSASAFTGISLRVYVREAQQVQRAGKKATVYRLVFYMIDDDVNVPSHVGEHVDTHTIRLKLEWKHKMSPDELAAYREKHPNDKKREYDTYYDGWVDITEGTEVRLTAWTQFVKESNNAPFRSGSFAIARGLHVTQKENNQYGPEWSVTNLQEDPKAFTHYAMLDRLSASTRLLNVGPSNPLRSEANETENDQANHRICDENTAPTRMSRQQLILGMLPLSERVHADQFVTVPLQSLPAATIAKNLANKTSVVFATPTWPGPFTITLESSNNRIVKATTMQCTALQCDRAATQEDNAFQQVCVQIRFSTDSENFSLLNHYGIVDPALFGDLAPVLLPACPGYVAANMDAVRSFDLCSSLYENKAFDYGVYAFARDFEIDLLAGIHRCGFPLEYALAREAVAAVMNGTTNFADDEPSENARANPLNVASKPRVINLREATVNMSDIADAYSFFLVTTISRENASDRKLTSMADINGLGKYTVFAVRTQALQEHEDKVDSMENLDTADFAQAFLQASERKRAAEAELQAKKAKRLRVIAEELQAAQEMALDDDNDDDDGKPKN